MFSNNYREEHSERAKKLIGYAKIAAVSSFISILEKIPEIEKIADNPDKLKKWDSTLTITFIGQAFMTMADKLKPEEDVNPMSYAIKDELNIFMKNGYDEMTKIMGFIKITENECKSIEEVFYRWGLAALSSFVNWDNTDPNFILLGQTALPKAIGVLTVKGFYSWWEE